MVLLTLWYVFQQCWQSAHHCLYCNIFFKKNWRTLVLFVGPLIPLFWTSGDICHGFQSQDRSPCLHASSLACTGIIRFTSSVTSVDLLATSMVAEPFQSTYMNTRIAEAWVQDLLCHYLTVSDKIDALMNELCTRGVFEKLTMHFQFQHNSYPLSITYSSD